ncbi:hypothetical protein F5879DRAFT_922817 [Lentinula edodes]|nr:hypothetical protein F5879DRAFT_922817 [Lentinula edodes]
MAFLVSILSLSFEFSTLLLFVLVAPQYIDGSSLEVPTSDRRVRVITHPTPHTLSPHLELEILSELKSTPGVRNNNECLGGAGDSAKVDGFKGAGFAVEGVTRSFNYQNRWIEKLGQRLRFQVTVLE